jgi:hypothetical protein
MKRKELNQVYAALSVVKESEAIRLHLMVSIQSSSSVSELIGTGLGKYLKAKRSILFVQLVICCLRMVCKQLSKMIITALPVVTSWITKRFGLMN